MRTGTERAAAAVRTAAGRAGAGAGAGAALFTASAAPSDPGAGADTALGPASPGPDAPAATSDDSRDRGPFGSRGLSAGPDPDHRPSERGLPHIPALDGVRAFAVMAVIGYHAGVGWLPGGLLGVDVFFVLSGFLITSLLLAEWGHRGRVDLPRFWLRRARRLVPALLLVLLAVAVYSLLAAQPEQRAALRGDGLSTLAYVANWHFAFTGQGYFDSFAAPSPLLHMWSLAVEEQFYLLWPLITILVVCWTRRGPRTLGRVALI
ncbi:MAG: acyltransferase family protein, partial [Frankiaceae bacterium]